MAKKKTESVQQISALDALNKQTGKDINSSQPLSAIGALEQQTGKKLSSKRDAGETSGVNLYNYNDWLQSQRSGSQASVPSYYEKQEKQKQLDDLVSQYRALPQRSNSIPVVQQRNQLLSQIRNMEKELGLGESDYTFSDRSASVIGGATKQSASGILNFLGTKIAGLSNLAKRLGGSTDPNAGYAVDDVSAANINAANAGKAKDNSFYEEQQNTAKKIQDAADRIGESASLDIARAKNGLGSLGKAGVDIATNVIQMGYDAALGAGSLAGMFVRSAGASEQEARLAGASTGKQILYGAASGGIEVFTEKMFDGVARIYGAGAADEIVESTIRKLSKSDFGRSALRWIVGAAGEGVEEVISDLLAPYAEMAYNGKSFSDTLGGTFKGNYDPSEILYDFIIGAAVGGLGGGVSLVNGQNAQANAALSAADSIEAELKNSGFDNRRAANLAMIGGRVVSGSEVSEKDFAELQRWPTARSTVEKMLQGDTQQATQPQSTAKETKQPASDAEKVQAEVEKLGVPKAAAEVIADDYSIENTGVSPQMYSQAVKEVFDLVKVGLEKDQIKENSTFATELTDRQLEHAYSLAKAQNDTSPAAPSSNVAEVPSDEDIAEAETIEDFSKAYSSPEAVQNIYNQAPETEIESFKEGFSAAYEMGNSSVPFKYVTESSAPGLTESQRSAAYNLGKSDAASKAKVRNTKVNFYQRHNTGKNLAYTKGTVKGEGVTIADLKKTFNDSQNTAYRLLTKYAETTGVNIVLFKSQADENGQYTAENGRFQWKDNTIYIDINSGLNYTNDVDSLGKYTMLRTFAHEFTHFVEKWNPEEYNNFREFVFNVLDQNGENVNDLIEEKLALDSAGKMTYEQASREVVADAMTDILPDSTLVQQLAQENRTVFNKLLENLRQFTSRLKQYYAQLTTRASREAEALKKNSAYMESIVKMWDDIAKGAVRNYQQTVGEELIDQPPKPANLPKRSKQQKNVRSAEENAQQAAENAQGAGNVPKRAGMDFFRTGEYDTAEETAPVLKNMVQKAPQKAAEAQNTEEAKESSDENLGKYTGAYSDLWVQLEGSYEVKRDGLVFSYEKVGERFESWRGDISIDNAQSAGGVPIMDARSHIWNGTQKTREGIIQTLVGIAQNNKLLDNKEVNANGEESNPTADNGGAPGNRSDGRGTVRVLDELEAGSVQLNAEERGTDSAPAGGGREAGRDGDRADAERDGRTGSTGSGETGDIRRADGLTSEQAEKQAEETHAEVEATVEEKSTVNPKGSNFVIGDSLNLPKGSKSRYKANVDAIRLVKQLEAENRIATPAEQEILSKYVGWGGIQDAFDEKKSDWSKEFKELKELLTDSEYAAARASTLNAHYTDISVIKAMYNGLNKLGFAGGRMLEPSSGVGNFVGAMPADMSSKVKSWTMVELDDITGLIAKHLYPNADVRIQGFEKANIPNNYMDVAISNVPFGDFGVTDKSYPKNLTSTIHNYFFVKSLDKVRPGGIVMFITSSYTMNSRDETYRKYIMKNADLLGAIRLPNTAFKSNANTSVVADILVLKKRAPGTAYNGETFLSSPYIYKNGYHGAYINEYFKTHPDMVLGQETIEEHGMHGRDEYTVNPYSDRGSLAEQIDTAFENIKGKMDYPVQQTPDKTNFAVERAEKQTKQGGFVSKGGKNYQNNNGVLEEVNTDEKTAKRITGMLGIRDAARELLNAQQQGVTESNIKSLRKKLNSVYDSFVKEYGYINSPANKKAFADDPDKFSLYALEDYDAKAKTATKADIFSTNTVVPNRTVTHVDTVREGLVVSRNTTGGVDVDLIARLSGKTAEQVTRELIDSEQVFKNRDGELEPAEIYLSGNVRAKLRDAQGIVGIDKDYQHNIDALKSIIPEDIPHESIYVQPGTPWIPDTVYSDFAARMLGTSNYGWRGQDIYVHRSNETGNFTVELKNPRLKSGYRNTQEWGTADRSFLNLFEAMLNSRSVTVSRKDAEGRSYVDEVATAAANEKVEKIKEEFTKWLWEDAERTADLEYLYNETFNAIVTPKYDGSTLTVNGMRAGYALREHQANAVQRVISSGGNTLLAHKVGAGKTMEMAASAMKLKELGIINKPMFAVPKSLVAQWGKEFNAYFPAAKLLVAEQSDFTPANRKTFANRISTGNYDAIIVSYEQFEKIPISDEFALSLYQEQINEIIAAIEEAKEASGQKSLSVKDLEKKRKQLQTKIDKLTDKPKDVDNISFEELGVDSIFVDEAHNFKNLFYTTSMNNVAGLGNKDGSKRAFDMYTKVRYLQQLNNGRGIVFATATPVMNSMSEMYIMQRYLQPDLLKQLGLSTFDSWAKQFGEVVNGVEIKPSGQGYRLKQSFSRFKNIGELQLLFRNFSDVLTDIPGLKIPKLKGGSVKIVECEPGEFQKNYMKELEKRADNIKNVDPSEDNMLKITSDGRKISYTQRMIDPSLPYEEGCKIYKCADNVVQEYKDSNKIKGTQIIFCDMATPKGRSAAEKESTAAASDETIDTDSARLYDDLKARLVKKGIPSKEIAFIHDADTDEKKSKLFDDVNAGKVRVLIGSTGKMGVGMNAQKRIVAIHHLDAPWRPGDVEQRNGRAFRQGNINEEVSDYTYVTTGSFDARLWDILDRKQRFIDQIMNGEDVGREVEDTGEVTLSAAEVKALASGNPLIEEQVKLENNIKKLEKLYMAHNAEKVQARKKLADAKAKVAELETRIENGKKDIKLLSDTYSDEKFAITVGNKKFTDKKEAGEALMAKAIAEANNKEYKTIGEFAGLEIRVLKTSEGINGVLYGSQGYQFKTYPERTTYMITRLQDLVKALGTEYISERESMLKEAKAEITAQENIIQQPFEKQAELDSNRARYNEVMDILNPKEEQPIASDDESGSDGIVEFSRRPKENESDAAEFRNDIDHWNKSGKPSGNTFILGSTGEVLQGLGAIESDIYMRGDKIKAILDDHAEMSIDEIKRIPDILNNPTLILKSKGKNENSKNTRVIVFGTVKASNGLPVMAVLDLLPVEDHLVVSDMQRVTSAYTKTQNPAGFVSSSEVLYADNSEKTTKLLRAIGLQSRPIALELGGYVGSISYDRSNVNVTGVPYEQIFGSENITESSTRTQSTSNTEILSMAAEELDSSTLTAEERNALDIFKSKLSNLKNAQDQRKELGQKYKDQQFKKGGSREEAAKIRNQMSVMDGRVKRLESELLSLENKDVLKSVLVKARGVIEESERKRSSETLKQYRERRVESAAVRKYRAKVKADVETLRKWLMNPSNKNIIAHVPAEMQKSVADFIDSINLMSKRALASSGLETTKADEKYLKSMKKMHDAIKANIDLQGAYSGYADLPEDFLDTFEKLIASTEDHMQQNSGTFVVNEMTAAELKQLSKTLKTLKKYIATVNKFHNNAMFQHAYDAGEETVKYLSEFSKSKQNGTAYNFMNFKYMRPSYVFERFGKAGESIEHEFRDAQAMQARLAKQIIDFTKDLYTKKEVDEWSKDVKSFTLQSGEKISLPATGIMSLYCLNKREQAKTHIYGDGIRVANFKDGKHVVLDEGHLVTYDDVDMMIDSLTNRQIEIADKLQNFMSTVCSSWGNYVSMARFDVEQFTEENYFPINSDGRYIAATADETPSNASLYALLNISFTKELKENAKNRIILYNIFDVFANHAASMTQYRSFALPILDTLKWFNYKNEDSSVREKLSLAFGAPVEERAGSGSKGYAETFVLNLLKQYNGTEGFEGSGDAFLSGFLHRFNRAQVAYNARVVIQQPMAITRAAMILSPAKLTKGLGMSAAQFKKLSEEMEANSGIAAWKSLGFYDTNISRGLTSLIKQDQTFNDKVTEKGMAGAEFADKFTWTAMWAAAKDSVDRKSYSSEEEYLKAVSDLFDEVIYKTQVVDSVLTKSEMLKNKDWGSRFLGSFMSEPSATMSMLTASFAKYTDAMQRGKSRSEAWQQYGGNIVKTIGVYAIGQIMLSAVQSVADAWRDDDDFESFLEKYVQSFKTNVIDELAPFGKIPLVSEMYEIAKYALDKFGVFEKLGLDMYGNTMSGYLEAANYLYKFFDVTAELVEGNTGYKWYASIYNLVRFASSISGFPLSAGMREFVDIWNNTVGFFSPSRKIVTYRTKPENSIKSSYLSGTFSEEKAKELLISEGIVKNENEAFFKINEWDGEKKYGDLSSAVISGDAKSYSEAVKTLKEHGVKDKEIKSAAKSAIKKAFVDEKTIDVTVAAVKLRQYSGMTAEDASQTAKQWKCEVETGISYSNIKTALDDKDISRAEAISMLKKYGSMDNSKATTRVDYWEFTFSNPHLEWSEDTYISYTDKYKPIGLTASQYNTYKAKKANCKGTDDDNDGKTDSGSKKAEIMEIIDAMSLSQSKKDEMYYAEGWAEKTLKDAPWH